MGLYLPAQSNIRNTWVSTLGLLKYKFISIVHTLGLFDSVQLTVFEFEIVRTLTYTNAYVSQLSARIRRQIVPFTRLFIWYTTKSRHCVA